MRLHNRLRGLRGDVVIPVALLLQAPLLVLAYWLRREPPHLLHDRGSASCGLTTYGSIENSLQNYLTFRRASNIIQLVRGSELLDKEREQKQHEHHLRHLL